MQIVRLKRGYRIRLTDTEFDLVSEMVQQGQQELAFHDGGELFEGQPHVKRLWENKGARFDFFCVTEDRRK